MKIVKKLLRVCTLVLTLTLLLAVPAFANGGIGNGTGGDVNEGNGSRLDGFRDTKTGYIVYASNENGVATSPIVAFLWDGGEPYSLTGSPVVPNLATRFGQQATFNAELKAPWGYPPFSGTAGSRGEAIKDWLLHTPYGDCEKGMDYVMGAILGFSDAQIQAWYDNPNSKLNVEPMMFGGIYLGGSPSSFANMVYVGSTTAWANAVDEHNWGAVFTHWSLPNSLEHEQTWYAQFPAPSVRTGKHDSGTILSQAYGIITVTPITGKQLVKVYKTNGVVDNTTYGFTASPVELKDEGSYKIKRWNTSKTKTKATSRTADYPEVTAGCELKQSGSSPATVTLTAEESAIFVLLEREEELVSPALAPESIRAHELNYIFTLADGIRDETAAPSSRLGNVESDFLFNEILEAKYRKETTDTLQNWHTDETFKVAEDVSGDSANSGREVHYYVGGTISAMTEYLPWTEMKEFSINTLINPHYSVNVSRVKWESNLHTVQYRDSGMNGYAESVLGITPALVGEITSADPGANVENTLPDTENDTYTYTAKIKEYWQERTKSESTYIDEEGEEQRVFFLIIFSDYGGIF